METEEKQITMMPRIGDVAPDFDAVTTKGKILAFKSFLLIIIDYLLLNKTKLHFDS